MKKLTKKRQLWLYGLSGMGVNMLNLIVGSYLCSALMVENYSGSDIGVYTYFDVTVVSIVLWSIMRTIAKVVDGVIDIPLANLTDRLKTRWGRRRPAILVGLIFTLVFYVAFLFPLTAAEHSILNTIWLGIMLCLFYTFYSVTMTTYYATFSEIVDNEKDRALLSNFKTVFDIVYFVLGYALIPLILSGAINIRIVGLIFMPLALTMIIPLFMIKEKSTLDKDREEQPEGEQKEGELATVKETSPGLIKSFVLTMTNKPFIIWMVVYSCLQFGVQMFLTGNNEIFSVVMGFTGGISKTLIMACAFAPIPLFLLLYNKLIGKFGLRWGYVFSVGAFAVAMTIMAICREDIIPDYTTRLALACVGGVISAMGTGSFFSISYTVPSNIASNELKTTGVSHPAMYFAVQGLIEGVVAAVSTGLVFTNLAGAGLLWIAPIIIVGACVVSIALTPLLPKEIKFACKKQLTGTELK